MLHDPDSLALDVAGTRLTLLADRALYWQNTATLLVADVHLGKGAALRRLGVAIPGGGSRDDLLRLATLIATQRPQRLVILGDLFHARLTEDDDALVDAFAAFRSRHAQLDVIAIRGNHDRKTSTPPTVLGVDWHDTLEDGPFLFAHEPEPDARGYVLAGHLHPALRLSSRGDTLRLPTFWFGPHVGVLPSFGSLTGGAVISPAPGDRCVVVTPAGLVDLSPSEAQRSCTI